MSIAANDIPRGHPRMWHWVVFAALAAAIAFAFQESWSALLNTWSTDTTFSHGWLIVPMSLFLAWQRREDLARVTLRPSWIGLVVLGIALGTWLLGRLAHVRMLEQVGLIGMLQSLVPLVLGLPATRVLAFPLAFLWFAVPFGKELVPPLMEITADLSVFFLRLTGVPVYRDGMLLQIPAGTYEVARACSGIKFLTAAAALGAFFAYLNYRSVRKRITFVAAALVVAIVSNGVRAYLLVLIGHLTNMTFRHDKWHIVLGYVVFAVILAALFYIGARYRDPDPRRPVAQPATPDENEGGGATAWLISLLALVLLIGAPLYASAFMRSGGSQQAIAALSVRPQAAAGWQDAGDAGILWRPHISGGVHRIEGTYQKGDSTVDLYVEIFPLPGAVGSEMIAYRNSIQIDANERLYPDRVRMVAVPGHEQISVRETQVSAGQTRLVWYWYDVAGQTLVSPSRAKLAETMSLLTHGRGAQRVIVISTPVEDEARARATLADFVSAHGGQLLGASR